MNRPFRSLLESAWQQDSGALVRDRDNTATRTANPALGRREFKRWMLASADGFGTIAASLQFALSWIIDPALKSVTYAA